jgi:hypothetical protein
MSNCCIHLTNLELIEGNKLLATLSNGNTITTDEIEITNAVEGNEIAEGSVVQQGSNYILRFRKEDNSLIDVNVNVLKDIYLAKDHPITELKDHCSRDAKEGTNIVEYLYKEPLINLEKVHYKEKDFHKLIYDEFSLKMDPSELDFPFLVKNKKMTHALLFNLDVDNPLTLHYHLHFLKQNNILPSVVNKFEKLKKECNLSQYYYFKSLMT